MGKGRDDITEEQPIISEYSRLKGNFNDISKNTMIFQNCKESQECGIITSSQELLKLIWEELEVFKTILNGDSIKILNFFPKSSCRCLC